MYGKVFTFIFNLSGLLHSRPKHFDLQAWWYPLPMQRVKSKIMKLKLISSKTKKKKINLQFYFEV